MGFVVKLANLIKKKQDSEGLDSVEGADKVFNKNWSDFVEGELKESNNTNAKVLGGRPRSVDEDENQFDVNMEKIMSRFNTFNSMMS